ncbi:LCM-domain-containing protein [Penicillium alfredii]|uniref:tRNA wybutosine-synthesizing protein 4 n=1 Tax=Penicillium alfredii TaxID=1506179 RepID=A0A9W9KE64_9EURO|nr:LCM-domain-containing protein [Penicillium alfredii]KAJ5101732.1 LCM-domain-containing protein [Penicillium alfredii]
MPAEPAMAPVSKAEKEADVVMGTNTSSIASKRSVEMIYYPKPHFFRYFVKKPQRRSPINNRGYWLRMHAMTKTVREFIDSAPADKPKFVLNLGCGYDPLPFMLLSDEMQSTRRGQAVFVDIDYEKLMVNKKNAIHQTKEITDVLGEDVEFLPDQDAIQIRSPQYIAVGCDLKNLAKLDDVLRTRILPSADCSVLFLAEVSLTYMDVESANAVINWASTLTSDAQFCLLEQFFPDGPDHPFAATMMAYYNKLGAPLYSINKYHSLAQQEQRFKTAGWTQTQARNLWEIWSDSEFLPDATRKGLDTFEAFDEWEEFALWVSHYFLLMASNRPGPSQKPPAVQGSEGTDRQDTASSPCQLVLQPHCPTDRRGRRRFGALVPDSDGSFGHHGGLGQQARLTSTDLYAHSDQITEPRVIFPSRDIPARMCHTVTTLNRERGDCILVGGRASPTAPFRDCWLRRNNEWCQTHPLPEPRFRHSAASVSLEEGSDWTLIYGGKSESNQILDSWLLRNSSDGQGWQALDSRRPQPEARFGACFATMERNSGVLFGGIGNNGTILQDFWIWSVSRRPNGSPQVELTDLTSTLRNNSPQLLKYLSRFGATVNSTSLGLVVAGGIIPRQILPADKEILMLDSEVLLGHIKDAKPCRSALMATVGLGHALSGPRPLLTGHAACTVNPDQVLLLGGGARLESAVENQWSLVAPPKEAPTTSSVRLPVSKSRDPACGESPGERSQIPRTRIESAAQFQQIVAKGKPVVIEGSDIGPCTELWTKEYLIDAVGEDRKVVVHAAQSETMNFQKKNFSYATKDFRTFLEEVHAGGRQYLRSISAEQPSKLPANLATEFPRLNQDFRLSEHLSLVTENAHSSPLRISGPVTMWLHYDVMANVLCQVRGERQLILFPPDDVQALHLPAGASSSTIDIFHNAGADSIASIPGTSPHEAILKPGDILFLPPLWLHTACSPCKEQVSVAVNVFFRNLSNGYAAGRDVYGNRDLQAYEKSRQDLQKVARSFDGVPPDMARFYLQRLAQELQEIADQ